MAAHPLTRAILHNISESGRIPYNSGQHRYHRFHQIQLFSQIWQFVTHMDSLTHTYNVMVDGLMERSVSLVMPDKFVVFGKPICHFWSLLSNLSWLGDLSLIFQGSVACPEGFVLRSRKGCHRRMEKEASTHQRAREFANYHWIKSFSSSLLPWIQTPPQCP